MPSIWKAFSNANPSIITTNGRCRYDFILQVKKFSSERLHGWPQIQVPPPMLPPWVLSDILSPFLCILCPSSGTVCSFQPWDFLDNCVSSERSSLMALARVGSPLLWDSTSLIKYLFSCWEVIRSTKEENTLAFSFTISSKPSKVSGT